MKRLLLSNPHRWLLIALLVAALIVRVIGINWDQHSHMHPDERFVTTIASEIGDENALTAAARGRCPDTTRFYAYFDTECSIWNPNNVSDGSYVYGTLPLFIVRIAAQAAASINLGGLENPAQWTSYDYIHLVGRFVNALADTLTVLMIYVIGRQLFSRKHGLLAAALYAFAALPIQLSHYWTVDIQSGLFLTIALFATLEVARRGRFWGYLLFGLAFGAAMASRINLYPMAGLLPLALILRYWTARPEHWRRRLLEDVLLSVFAAAISLMAFRVFQPYAFVGPRINDWTLATEWLTELEYVSGLSRVPSEGWPPSIQWFGRIPFGYAWYNMAVWGMGIAFGLAATAALVAAFFVQVRARRPQIALGLLAVWVLAYFVTTGGLHQMTMRYYLPLYGSLAVLAAWGLFALPHRVNRIVVAAAAVLSIGYGLAFLNIYTQPFTRVEASRWIFANQPATFTLSNAEGEQLFGRIPESRFDIRLQPALRSESYLGEPFQLLQGQTLSGLEIQFTDDTPTNIQLQLYLDDGTGSQQTLFSAFLQSVPDMPNVFRWQDPGFELLAPGTYRWHILNNWDEGQDMRQFMAVSLFDVNGAEVRQGTSFLSPYEPTPFILLDSQTELNVRFEAPFSADTLTIPHIIGSVGTLSLSRGDQTIEATPIEIAPGTLLGSRVTFALSEPLTFEAGTDVRVSSAAPIYLTGTVIVTEGAWDDSVPLRFCERRPTDNFLSNLVGGFQQDCEAVHGYSEGYYIHMPLNMAEADTELKLRRMRDILGKGDVLVISSNRFYDAQPRLTSRFPVSHEYYDLLFAGDLGYALDQTFQRSPSLLGINIPHQYLPTSDAPRWLNELEAEEAFTVYDHPTVFIFRNDGFNQEAFPVYTPYSDSARNFIDLQTLPAATYPLTGRALTGAEETGSVVGWVAAAIVAGWLVYPLMFVLFPNLPLRGFAVGRAIAWLGFAFIVWWLSAVGVTFFWTPQGLALTGSGLIIVNLVIFMLKRREITAYVRANGFSFLLTEFVFVVALAIGLLLRAVNPDLWNVGRGGEKPMDFAYLNAVLRTPVFPPPNPWMAGFEINYYYFGFVIAALPIKLGSFASEIGYNLAMGTLYPVVFMVIFTLIQTLMTQIGPRLRGMLALLGASFAMASGNLGTLWLLLFPEPNMDAHRWYWAPTRLLGESANRAGGAINEFPMFSFLFGDLHAHVVALLPTSLVLMVFVLIVREKRWWQFVSLGILSAILLMTNTWDVLLYVPLGILVVWLASRNLRGFIRGGILVSAAGVIAVAPFYLNFSSGAANGVELWNGERSLIEPWLLVWGAPLLIVFVWLLHRARQTFYPDAKAPLELALISIFALAVLAFTPTVATSVLCLLLVVLALLLYWRDAVEMRLIHGGIALVFGILLAIEYVVVRNDVGRMNTIFKISYQLWIWLAVLTPLVIAHFIQDRKRALALLSAAAFVPGLLFAFWAIPGRFEENLSGEISLDGNRFLRTIMIPPPNGGAAFDAFEDADLIYFLRREVSGFPVIAEWYDREYAWNSRISVQTGLPSVIGWANHMRQQYSTQPQKVDERISDLQLLYTSPDVFEIRRIIDKYAIEYIVVGRLEQAMANPESLNWLSFMAEQGELTVIYSFGSTLLYRVNPDTTS